MTKTLAYSAEPSILQSERRRYPRIHVAVQIEIRPEGLDVPMRLETTDLSGGGCYVEMALTLDIGTRLDIVLWLDGEKVTTRGVVVTRHTQFGNGIEFVGMFSDSEKKLNAFLDSHEVPSSIHHPFESQANVADRVSNDYRSIDSTGSKCGMI